MDFKAERVKELICSKCGHHLDPKRYKPLAQINCPECNTEMHVPAVFDRQFLLTEPIGNGTSGIAFRAFDDQLHRQVALKVLKHRDDDDRIAKDCIAEARALASMNHPNIVQIYSIGKYLEQHYFVMELLSGQTAGHYTQPRNMLTEAAALDMTIAIAEALAAASRMGLVHMDVKPQNILFARDGRPKVIDFGAARYAKDGNPVGKVIGTPYYIAPEVARGHKPDLKSDIYNLGATLFHLLAGVPPFQADSPIAVVKRRLKEPPPSVYEFRDNIHPNTQELIDRMMAVDPEERYDSYEDLIVDLRAAFEIANDDPPILAGGIEAWSLEAEADESDISDVTQSMRGADFDDEPSRAARPLAPGSGRPTSPTRGRPSSPTSRSGRPASPLETGETAVDAYAEEAHTPSGMDAGLSNLAAAAASQASSSSRTSTTRLSSTRLSSTMTRTISKSRRKKSRGPNPMVFVGIAGGVLLIVAILIVVLNNNKGGDDLPTTDPATPNTPPFIEDASFQGGRSPIGFIKAGDADGDSINFSIIAGDPNGAFKVEKDGTLVIAHPERLLQGQKAALLNVMVQDGRGGSATAKIRVIGLSN